jgi:4-hydroxybutyrate CoA-transferase
MDGHIVGTFAAGTDKLYDWLDRNPEVALLPIRQVNDPHVIGLNDHMKSINSALLIDLNGQVASDAVGYQQISGIGGQLEFVMGSQRSKGGRSILCRAAASRVKGKLVSNIVASLPPGTPVTVPRQLADVIVTEYGAAEIKELNAVDRVRALVGIAHPAFRGKLMASARRAGLWERRAGFKTFAQRAIFNNLGYVRRLTAKLERRPADKHKIVADELRQAIGKPDLVGRLVRFYRQNRA